MYPSDALLILLFLLFFSSLFQIHLHRAIFSGVDFTCFGGARRDRSYFFSIWRNNNSNSLVKYSHEMAALKCLKTWRGFEPTIKPSSFYSFSLGAVISAFALCYITHIYVPSEHNYIKWLESHRQKI
jgi:hypothetical protein